LAKGVFWFNQMDGFRFSLIVLAQNHLLAFFGNLCVKEPNNIGKKEGLPGQSFFLAFPWLKTFFWVPSF